MAVFDRAAAEERSVAFLEFIPPPWSALLDPFWGPALIVDFVLTMLCLAYWVRHPHRF
jgi:hypothetical protein